jgi:epidermal growth factor receptor substrate 15
MGAQTAELQKTREELIRAESDLSAVRVEKAEIEGAFMRDKEDVRELHRKMAETGTEIAGLKLEIEKAKKEAKQQKGLLAIARKQLSTKETEKTKVVKELEEAQGGVREVIAERESAEAELQKDDPSVLQNGHDIVQSPIAISSAMAAALAQPLPVSLPVSPDPATPSTPGMKSNNPFDRLARSASSASSARSRSPFPPPTDTPVVPTPTAAPADVTVDPFSVSQAYTEAGAEKNPEVVTTEATPRSDPIGLSVPQRGESHISCQRQWQRFLQHSTIDCSRSFTKPSTESFVRSPFCRFSIPAS